MSFWGKLFGTDEALKSVVDGVKGGLDSLVYTDQEKARDAAAATTEARSMVVQWMAATSGQNLARRLISLAITFIWLLQYVLAQVAGIAAIWMDEPDKAYKLIELMQTGNDDMAPAVMLVLGFYFAAPYMGSIATAMVQKMAPKQDTPK